MNKCVVEMPNKEANTNNNAVNRRGNNLRDLGNDRVRCGQIMVTQFRDHGNDPGGGGVTHYVWSNG